jgi:hypothetical protein
MPFLLMGLTGRASAAGQISFGAVHHLGVPGAVVAARDLNHDGNLDVVSLRACPYSNCPAGDGFAAGDSRATVLLGNGSGAFTMAPGSPFALGPTKTVPPPTGAALGDVNRDGQRDLVTANSPQGATDERNATVSVLLGNGAGGFTSAPGSPISINKPNLTCGFVAFTDPLRPRHSCTSVGGIAIGDLNGDQKPDLAASTYQDSGDTAIAGYSILLGNGTGTFTVSTWTTSDGGGRDAQPTGIAIGDLNTDGRSDLAIANAFYQELANVSVLLGNGSGGFGASPASPVAIGYPGYPGIAIGNLNGDQVPDVAAVASGDDSDDYFGGVAALLGDGSGGFTRRRVPMGTEAPQSVTISDLNGDANQDLAAAGTGSFALGVSAGDGSGGFGYGDDFAFNGNAPSIATGDLNSDGKPDAVLGGAQTLILFNTSPLGPVDVPIPHTKKQRVGDLLSDGVGVNVPCQSACEITTTLKVGKKTRRDLGVKKVVGRGTTSLPHAGNKISYAKFTPKAKKALSLTKKERRNAKPAGIRTLRLNVKTKITDSDGYRGAFKSSGQASVQRVGLPTGKNRYDLRPSYNDRRLRECLNKSCSKWVWVASPDDVVMVKG